MADYKDEFKGKADELKEKASEYVDDVKETVGEIAGDTKGAIEDVKEEAQEVFQEAKAVVTGQKLDSANTVGGAGYRADNSTSNGAAVASLVLGILSIICSFFGYSSIAGLILGIIGVSLGAKARKQSQTGIATAGFVCSIIGLILSALGLVCAIACAGAAKAILSQAK